MQTNDPFIRSIFAALFFYSRYLVIVILLLSIFSCNKSEDAVEDDDYQKGNQPVLTGAIRWDAWYDGPVEEAEEKILSPSEYQERAPFFSEIISENEISIQGNSEEVMGREIDFAVQSGIDYWAILTYPWFLDANNSSTGMSRGATLYLEHSEKEKINFCWIVGSHLYWHKGRWDKMIKRALETCLMSNYQTVMNGRPLIYFYNTGMVASESNIQTSNDRLHNLSELIISAGGKDPYYVFMGWNLDNWPKAKRAGFDAWSFYAGGGTGSYTDAAQQVRIARWEKPAEKDIPLVPVVSSGWNRLPRITYHEDYGPLPWWSDDQYSSDKIDQNAELPEPSELAAHLSDALAFTKENEVCEANTCIIYAWNEHSEGGWICPTVTREGGVDSSRIVAIGEVLKE